MITCSASFSEACPFFHHRSSRSKLAQRRYLNPIPLLWQWVRESRNETWLKPDLFSKQCCLSMISECGFDLKARKYGMNHWADCMYVPMNKRLSTSTLVLSTFCVFWYFMIEVCAFGAGYKKSKEQQAWFHWSPYFAYIHVHPQKSSCPLCWLVFFKKNITFQRLRNKFEPYLTEHRWYSVLCLDKGLWLKDRSICSTCKKSKSELYAVFEDYKF